MNIAIGDWSAATIAHARGLGLVTSTWKLDVTGGFREAENQRAIDLGLDWAMTDRVRDLALRAG